MDKSSDSKTFSIGFLGILTLIFITLKLCDKIDWSWWYVLAPLWIPWSILIFPLMFLVIASFIFKK
jgi:hypothetical protein